MANSSVIFAPLKLPNSLRSVSTGLFLAMDSKGRLYGEADRNDEGTVFAEHTEVRFLLKTIGLKPINLKQRDERAAKLSLGLTHLASIFSILSA